MGAVPSSEIVRTPSNRIYKSGILLVITIYYKNVSRNNQLAILSPQEIISKSWRFQQQRILTVCYEPLQC